MANNKTPKITGKTHGTLHEDAAHTQDGGDLNVNGGADQFQTINSLPGTFGTFSIDAQGRWTYVLDNSRAATQALDQGQKQDDSFVVRTADGRATETVVVTIHGERDTAPPAPSPVAHSDTARNVITFDTGSYTQVADPNPSEVGYIITTHDGYVFARDPAGFAVSGALVEVLIPDVYNSNLLYTFGRYEVDPADIVFTRADGGAFGFQSANIFGENNLLLDGGFETVTGYYNGVQVAQQSFHAPEAYTTSVNVVDFTDPMWRAVDKVVFHIDINHEGIPPGTYFSDSHQLDNLRTLSTTHTAVDVNVLANDTPGTVGDTLAVASFSSTSAMGAAITLNPDGTLHYDPTVSAQLQAVGLRQVVTDSFTYAVQDQHGGVSNVATVSIEVVGLA